MGKQDTQQLAARLVKALEEYWPEGCPMFKENPMHPDIVFYADTETQPWCICHNHITTGRIATIAAVAAQWFWRLGVIRFRKYREATEASEALLDEFQADFSKLESAAKVYENIFADAIKEQGE